MRKSPFSDHLLRAKVLIVELCSTAVFFVFVSVETVRAIRHILQLWK